MAAIDIKGLTYTYPGSKTPALKNINLQVEAGQMLAVIGANGAGKSTLCLALASLIPNLYLGEMQGVVTVAGMDTRQFSPGQFAGRVGLVLQNPSNQLSGMSYTLFEEVAFGLQNLGVPRSQMPDRILAALQQVGLQDLSQRSPYSLSGGQQQRLALASILALEPQILILDEPTSMLDPAGSQDFFAVIQKCISSGTTVVIVEHRLEWIAQFAHRVIALAEGEIVLEGEPQAVLVSPLLDSLGIGRLRYTAAASLAQANHLWPSNLVLPVTLNQAVHGFMQIKSPNKKEQTHVDPD